MYPNLSAGVWLEAGTVSLARARGGGVYENECVLLLLLLSVLVEFHVSIAAEDVRMCGFGDRNATTDVYNSRNNY